MKLAGPLRRSRGEEGSRRGGATQVGRVSGPGETDPRMEGQLPNSRLTRGCGPWNVGPWWILNKS